MTVESEQSVDDAQSWRQWRTPSTKTKGLIQAAGRIKSLLRDQADEAEKLGRYTDEAHDAMVEAGLYDALTPRRYGGHEIDIPSYFRIVIELASGDPGSGWCYALGQGHNLTTAGYWPEAVQDDVYRHPRGYFRAPQSVANPGMGTRVDDGYVVNSVTPFSSGTPFSTHAIVTVRLSDQPQNTFHLALVPIEQCTVRPDWGGDRTLGLRSSGSNTVVVDGQFVPADYIVPFDWRIKDYREGTVGTRLHGNPMYLARSTGFFHGEFAAIMTGAGRAALEEYEHTVATRKTALPPYELKINDHNYQRDYGMALSMVDAAEAITIRAAQQYMECCEDWALTGRAFDLESDWRQHGMFQRATQLATDAIQMLTYSAGSAATMAGQRMQRYFRDATMYRSHVSARYLSTAQTIAGEHFGLDREGF